MKLRWILLMALLLAGCMEVEISTKMNRNGEGIQTWHFSTTALMAGELQKQIESDPFFKKGKKILEEFKEGDFRIALEYPFRKVNELAYRGRDIRFESTGWFRKKCTYTEVWNKEFGDISGPLAKKTGNMIPLTLKVSVDMPGRIIRTNAAETKDSTAVWRFTLGELTGSRVMLVESVYWNWPLILPLATAVFLAAGGLALMLRRARIRNAPRPCPSCGAKTASAALFCAACGQKL